MIDHPVTVRHHTGDLLDTIRDSVIGADDLLDGPYGLRPITYADYTASGRALTSIEAYISDVVLPFYANTHTESSGTGLQTTRFREEAREIIKRSVGATDDHALLFCGSGATAAIAKIVGVLGLRIPSELEDKYLFSRSIPPEERPVVFVGPYEHHSNELPWRESIADVVVIDEDADGHPSLRHLAAELEVYQDRPLLIGSFSAASNVTGILTDTEAISTLLHRFGALAFWDFAAAAPYVEIDMGSAHRGSQAYMDAIFLSPHKFIGGPGTPGILVARKELFTNRVPDIPGGGTVQFVSDSAHDYLTDVEHREEGGTPDIIGAIRAGLVFQLKDSVGPSAICRIEDEYVRRAIESWKTNPAIEILGSHDAERLSIVSFVIHSGDRLLHHNFVVAVLNDLFGIQSRGGCSCAGPYGHRLLHIDDSTSHKYEEQIILGADGIKPGWTRLSFNYFIDEKTFRYIVDAVHLIAKAGYKLLPDYEFKPETGLWKNRRDSASTPMSLHDIDYECGTMHYENHRQRSCKPLRHYLDTAESFLESIDSPGGIVDRVPTSEEFERLRWFRY